ncbi:MAG: ribonuclease P protein component [Prevotella sp.]|nr:ribonuclease P protein component [Prevotella sp.]
MVVKQFGFRKRERLVSLRLIDELFGGGHSRSVAAFPLRAVFMQRPRGAHDEPLQMLISVPKKFFHHAVDRNRVKRQVREAWRLHKSLLAEALASDKQLLIAFVWTSDTLLPTSAVAERVANLTRRITEKL